jgi:hypothetical protein
VVFIIGSVGGVDPRLVGEMDRGRLSRGDESGFTEISDNLVIIHRYVVNKDEVYKHPAGAVLKGPIQLYSRPTKTRSSTPTLHSVTPDLDTSLITLPNPRPDLQTRYILQHPTRNSIQNRPSTPSPSLPPSIDPPKHH